MSKNIDWLSTGASVHLAAARMLERDVGFLPVCKEDGTVVGTVTEHDIVVRCVAGAGDFHRPVEEIMTPGAITCRPDDDLEEVLQRVRPRRSGTILVTDGQQRLLGTVSFDAPARRLGEGDGNSSAAPD
jgi:CBS domain-containing protein